jgi:prepilin-type N-terminal cleavage/methylation domain-containing protein
MNHRNQVRGFTLIELLVVISIIALLIAILLPSLTAARQEGIRLKCIANIKTITQAGAANSLSDNKGILHPMHESGKFAWRGLGGWDYGGSDGKCGEPSTRWTASPFNLGVLGRPFNIAVAGAQLAANTQFTEYRCPADAGPAQIDPNYTPTYVSPDPCSGAEEDEAKSSMYTMMGTSYQGDFIWYIGPQISQEPSAKRFGSFLCPTSKIKTASELIFFYESRFAQAFLATQEAVDSGGAFEGVVLDIPGWHGKLGEFNVSFCDGSARKIRLRSRGDAIDVVSTFDPIQWPFRSAMYRGNGTSWRFDNFPYSDSSDMLSDWVTECRVGDPCP